MRLDQPRIPPVPEAEWTPEQRAALEPLRGRQGVLNIFQTLARDPVALKAFLAWGNYVLGQGSSLPPREREILILRTGFLCRSGYEWAQHVRIGLRAGLSVDEIARIKAGAGANGWTPAESALLHAADELHADQFVSDPTWTALRAHFDDKACMDVVFTVGQYTQVSMILNSLGVQLDAGQALDGDLQG